MKYLAATKSVWRKLTKQPTTEVVASNVNLLDPKVLKPCYTSGDSLKPSMTTALYRGGVPTLAEEIKPSFLDASGNLKASMLDENGGLKLSMTKR